MKSKQHTNRLANETSPYLQQHAHNPVDWYPWGEEAIEKARAEDKPILLSIGYSACHWCHVMAHESFEEEQTAEVMNRLFVNVKVDREERPDLDKIYQTAHHLLTRRNGGWPLTMFLMPDDHVPFFGGTYFPPVACQGMPSFTELMNHIDEYYKNQRNDLVKQNDSVLSALHQYANKTSSVGQLTSIPLDVARQQLAKSYDSVNGGFGDAPKFPHPTNIERLMRHWAAKLEDEAALEMATQTLHAMASGGIYDQLGGGFCRYSVDERWEIPHFEKMLYDNGPLLSLYARAYKATGSAVFKRIVTQTGDWVIREMQSTDGGYYSTLDADSEGEEGKFYVWTQEEVEQALENKTELDVVRKIYGLDQPANFEGKWNFCVKQNTNDIAGQSGQDETEVNNALSSARKKLFNRREQRIRPGRDEKILTSWNGLMIKGMAEAGRLTGEEKFIDSAHRALDFVKSTLWIEGRLVATCKDGKAHIMAYLDDYVFLIDGILELLQARWCTEDLEFAIQLLDVVLEQFEDREEGGFYFTANDHEALIFRPKPFSDDALPSGNGVAASVCIRLGHLTGEQRFMTAAERTLKSAWDDITQFPHGHNALLLALEQYLYPGQNIILRGEKGRMNEWQQLCSQGYKPGRFVLAIPQDQSDLPGALANYEVKGQVVAYICEGFECQPPVMDKDELEARL